VDVTDECQGQTLEANRVSRQDRKGNKDVLGGSANRKFSENQKGGREFEKGMGQVNQRFARSSHHWSERKMLVATGGPLEYGNRCEGRRKAINGKRNANEKGNSIGPTVQGEGWGLAINSQPISGEKRDVRKHRKKLSVVSTRLSNDRKDGSAPELGLHPKLRDRGQGTNQLGWRLFFLRTSSLDQPSGRI